MHLRLGALCVRLCVVYVAMGAVVVLTPCHHPPSRHLSPLKAFAIFGTLGVFRHGFCYKGTLWALIVECSQLYRPNPFHNFRHAVDILHTTSLLLKAVEKRQLFAPLEVFAVAVAALAHDLDHPGVTNAFLVNTSEPLAIEYNDAAVLEQHHLATLFRLMQANPIANVFSRCNRDAYKSVRKVILETVRGPSI